MKKALSIPLALAMAVLTSCADFAYEAYDATPVFGSSRRVVKADSDFVYQFVYRGELVTYWPSMGAKWNQSRRRGFYSGNFGSSQLPNGCLVYACARAEEIRLHPKNRESRSQVICYRRADGSGHAFVLYQRAGQTVAEDDRGFRTPMPPYKSRGSSEALYMADTFQRRNGGFNNSPPVQAAFVGRY